MTDVAAPNAAWSCFTPALLPVSAPVLEHSAPERRGAVANVVLGQA